MSKAGVFSYPLTLNSYKPSEKKGSSRVESNGQGAPRCLPGRDQDKESWLRVPQIASLTPNSLQTPSLGRGSEFLWRDYH